MMCVCRIHGPRSINYKDLLILFDYLRILQFYDSSIFDTLEQLVPARAKSTTGVLIEPNILERSKQVIGLQPEFDNRYLKGCLYLSLENKAFQNHKCFLLFFLLPRYMN